jgi:hypothetical protein
MRAWVAGLRASGARASALRSTRPGRASSGHFEGDLGAAPRGPPALARLRLLLALGLSRQHWTDRRMMWATRRHPRVGFPASK